MPPKKSAAAAARYHPYRSHAASDQGQARTNNEDRCFASDEERIYFVIDGVGGMAAGERAAELAESQLLARLRRREDKPERRLREAIALAGKAIFEEAARDPELKGMSCVLTLALIEDGLAHIAHVGDSRLYLIAGGEIRKITHDHSPVGQMEDAGEIPEHEAMRHPRRNEIFRDVGSQVRGPDDPNFIETTILQLQPGTSLLLCSDGLSDELSSARILETVAAHRGDPARVTRELIRQANEAGGRDNVSVVYVEAADAGPAVRGRLKTPLWRPEEPRAADHIDTVEMPRTPVLQPPAPEPEAPARAGRAALLLAACAVGAAGHYVYQRQFAPPGPATLHAGATARYRTISDALAAAKPGDTVAVAPGIYLERVLLREGVAVAARPAGGARLQPRPDAAESAPVVEAKDLQHATLSGFVVAPASDSGTPVGILVENSGIDIVDNEIYGMREAAILVRGAGAAAIRGNHLHRNTGAAIFIENGAAARIFGNRVADNGGTEGTRAALVVQEGAAPSVEGNWFANNRADVEWKASRDALPRLEKDNFFSRPQPPSAAPRRGR